DNNILFDFMKTGADFGVELTKKTINDTKGGTLIKYDGKHAMFEVAQCSPEKLNEFTSFKYFNTNNIWIKLSAVKDLMGNREYLKDVDLIINPKKLEDGRECIQLEYAIGSMIKFFGNVRNYLVPRTRFIPVKRHDDLNLIKSEAFSLNKDEWKLLPIIKN
ncbi:MAG: UTP--glucose-1-phosphate uridylyltransferase, partial [Nitrososphaeraceae archaeon]|nr:UTP--glucose-1-phosphate uridylyltransferase [Nitrososphaeraceae archaeon]